MTLPQNPVSRVNRGSAVARARRRYGAHPTHLLLIIGCFVIAAPAGNRMLHADYGTPRRVTQWLIGGAVLHDGLLAPLYIAVDALLVTAWRRAPGRVAWINHVRVPAGISAVLLLVYASEILRRNTDQFEYSTGRSDAGYLPHWLFLSGLCFGASALLYLARLLAAVRRPRHPAGAGSVEGVGQ